MRRNGNQLTYVVSNCSAIPSKVFTLMAIAAETQATDLRGELLQRNSMQRISYHFI
ncbi:MAG: hypothetical protein NTX03_12635 [Bacteroidetes bacterium]|nr:hypothetical protein [Bacteroidota bacterium]